ncbi:MAG: class II fumarate hydratase [Pseudomonadota bacterium]
MGTRTERDSFGEIEVDDQHLWGAQTQRSLHHFDISTEVLAPELIQALAWVKGACAQVNVKLGLLPAAIGEAIQQAAAEVAEGRHADQFPLRVWQTGSGTQSNMNMNEVLAALAKQRLRSAAGAPADVRIHPNDHVNLGQSSNDIFPTAMHVAAVVAVERRLLPSLVALREAFDDKAQTYRDLIKVGRTHLQDAVPLTLGQELSAHVAALAQAETRLGQALSPVRELAVGGTAVGTGLNTHPAFGAEVCQVLGHQLGQTFEPAANLFAALALHDALVHLHAGLKGLAVALMKIANDIRWLASGPRAGLGELILPANEPGSSIMPGKVNPTQFEAMTMICCQVMGNDVTVSMAGAGGQLELNTFKPVIAHNLLQSIRLLGDGMRSLREHAIVGLQADPVRIGQGLERSLMLATALAPHIGYDRAAKIARKAHEEGLGLRDAAVQSGIAADDFDRWVRPQDMLAPSAVPPA